MISAANKYTPLTIRKPAHVLFNSSARKYASATLKKAMKNMRVKIKHFTAPISKLNRDIRDLVKGLNRKLQDFKNYYLFLTYKEEMT